MLYSEANQVALLVLLAACSGMLGWLMGRARRRPLLHEIERLEHNLARSSSQSREQMRVVAKLRGEQGSVDSLVRMLPGVVRDLNRSDLDPRRVPALVVELAATIFEPEQVLLYLVKSPGGASAELFLRAHRGLEAVPPAVGRVAFGDGKIGWVAESKVEMASDDWLNLSRTDGRTVENNHPALHLDLLGPLVHHSRDGEQLLGVLCVGKPGIRPRDEKLMLQMVTNLGSIALMNLHHLRQLQDRADHDGLTGLLNKASFRKKLGELMVGAETGARPLGVFIFDIDYFKRYNDSHGHLAGDELLKTMPRVLRENIRPTDLACRYGGEEFIVALPDTDGQVALEVAEKIRQAIEDFPFPHGNSQPNGNLTISGGVASFPTDGTNGTELISHADQALYQAKAAGRNRVVRYHGVQIGDPEADPGWPLPDVATS